MKTLQELMEETGQLHTMAASLHDEISEVINAGDEKEGAADFNSLMLQAERHPLMPHPLRGKEAGVIEAYLTMLLSVASRGSSSGDDSPAVYPCRIAAALSPRPDIESFFRKSMILDEAAVSKNLALIEEKHLTDEFVLDALRLIELYDRGNAEKIEYVSNLAMLLNVSEGRMEDLLALLKPSVHNDAKFVTGFADADIMPLVRYISPESHLINSHPLDGKDVKIVDAYLTLLLSVAVNPRRLSDQEWAAYKAMLSVAAACDPRPPMEEGSAAYPCQIAMSLREWPDMEALFKKALSLDEPAIEEALKTVDGEHLGDFFLFDAMRLVERYDRGSIEKSGYVFDLAEKLKMSQARIEDLLSLLKISVQGSTKIAANFAEIEFTPFMSYIQVSECKVVTPSEVVMINKGGITEQESWDFIGFSQLQGKKHVILEGVTFTGTNKTNPMQFSGIEDLEITNCIFNGFNRSHCFNANGCSTVRLKGCKFSNCSSSNGCYARIGNLTDVKRFLVESCVFENCDCRSRGYNSDNSLFEGTYPHNFTGDCQFDDNSNNVMHY